MTPNDAYEWLVNHYTDTAYLFSAAELIAWDQRTYIPRGGHAHRSRQMEALARLIHQRSTSTRIDDCLSTLDQSDYLSEGTMEMQANVRMWRKDYDRQTKIPESLASKLAGASSAGETAWEAAVREDDWHAFLPHLETLLALTKEKADAIGYDNEAYDALLDEYEIGLTTDALSALYDELKTPLTQLLKKIANSSIKPRRDIFHGQFPVDKQKEVCAKLVQAIGYSFETGRIDESVHPFSVGIGPGDSRITTRYNEKFLGSGLFGCLHEAGHSLYELGLPAAHFGKPAGMYLSLGVHESQSRFWENQVGRSEAFWRFAKPILDDAFPSVASASLEELVLAVNDVRPGLIRVEADEVAYNLHVMIRFELELAMFRNQLKPSELPDVWADQMEALLGVRPKTATEGAMQDIHWAAGIFGYFPTYSIGNIYAAQLFAAAQQQLNDFDSSLAAGRFEPLLRWLRSNVHEKGQCLLPSELITQATGEPPSSKFFMAYCENKYSVLYEL